MKENRKFRGFGLTNPTLKSAFCGDPNLVDESLCRFYVPLHLKALDLMSRRLKNIKSDGYP